MKAWTIVAVAATGCTVGGRGAVMVPTRHGTGSTGGEGYLMLGYEGPLKRVRFGVGAEFGTIGNEDLGGTIGFGLGARVEVPLHCQGPTGRGPVLLGRFSFGGTGRDEMATNPPPTLGFIETFVGVGISGEPYGHKSAIRHGVLAVGVVAARVFPEDAPFGTPDAWWLGVGIEGHFTYDVPRLLHPDDDE